MPSPLMRKRALSTECEIGIGVMSKQGAAAPRFMRFLDVLNPDGVSRRTNYCRIAAGNLPKQVPLGRSTVIWAEASF